MELKGVKNERKIENNFSIDKISLYKN